MGTPKSRINLIRVLSNEDGEGVGSGFLLNHSYAVTCAHVIDDSASGPGKQVMIEISIGDDKEEIQCDVLDEFWNPREKDDVAILKLLPRDDNKISTLALDSLGSVSGTEGDHVRIIGFDAKAPGGYEEIGTNGEVIGIARNVNKRPMLQIKVDYKRRGMSGAPILDIETGRIIGMFSEFPGEKLSQDYPNLSWGTSADTIHHIFSQAELALPTAIEGYIQAQKNLQHAHDYAIGFRTIYGVSKTISDVFVPLQMRRVYSKKSSQKESSETPDLDIEDLWLLAKDAPVIITGEAGSGKSTLLRFLALNVWNNPDIWGATEKSIPISFRAVDLATHGSLKKLMGGRSKHSLPEGFLADWEKRTDANLLFLVDGIDEVTSDKQKDLLENLNDLISNSPKRLLIGSSRQISFNADILNKGNLFEIELLPLGVRTKEKIARNLLKEEDIDVILDGINRDPGIISNPLYLTIACLFFHQNGSLPEKSSKLILDFIDLVFDSSKLNRSLKKELDQRILAIAKESFFHLAFEMTSNGEFYIEQNQALSWISKYFERVLNFSVEEARAQANIFLKIMAEGSGIFYKADFDFQFSHQTIQEHLCSQALSLKFKEKPKERWNLISKNIEEELWQEPFAIALSNQPDVSNIINKLLRLNRRFKESQSPLLLASRAIIKGASVNPEDKVTIIKSLSRLLKERVLPRYIFHEPTKNADAQKVWNLISKFDLNETKEYFLEISEDENVDQFVRILVSEKLNRPDIISGILRKQTISFNSSIFALERLGAIEELRDIVVDPKIKPEIRMACANALDRLGYQKDINELVWSIYDELYKSDQFFFIIRDVIDFYSKNKEWDYLISILKAPNLDHYSRVSVVEKLSVSDRLLEVSQILMALIFKEDQIRTDRDKYIHLIGKLKQPQLLLEFIKRAKLAPKKQDLISDGSEMGDIYVQMFRMGQMPDNFGDMVKTIFDNEQPLILKAIDTLGEFNYRNELNEIAKDSNLRVDVRFRAAKSLRELQDYKGAIETYVSLAKNNRIHAYERIQAAESLKELELIQQAARCLGIIVRDQSVNISEREQALIGLIYTGVAQEINGAVNEMIFDEYFKAERFEGLIDFQITRNKYTDLFNAAISQNLSLQKRFHIIKALGNHRRNLAIKALHNFIEDANQDALKFNAIQFMKQIGDIPKAIKTLNKIVESEEEDEATKLQALKELTTLGEGNFSCGHLLSIASNDKTPIHIRMEACQLLMNSDRKNDGLKILSQLTNDPKNTWFARTKISEIISDNIEADFTLKFVENHWDEIEDPQEKIYILHLMIERGEVDLIDARVKEVANYIFDIIRKEPDHRYFSYWIKTLSNFGYANTAFCFLRKKVFDTEEKFEKETALQAICDINKEKNLLNKITPEKIDQTIFAVLLRNLIDKEERDIALELCFKTKLNTNLFFGYQEITEIGKLISSDDSELNNKLIGLLVDIALGGQNHHDSMEIIRLFGNNGLLEELEKFIFNNGLASFIRSSATETYVISALKDGKVNHIINLFTKIIADYRESKGDIFYKTYGTEVNSLISSGLGAIEKEVDHLDVRLIDSVGEIIWGFYENEKGTMMLSEKIRSTLTSLAKFIDDAKWKTSLIKEMISLSKFRIDIGISTYVFDAFDVLESLNCIDELLSIAKDSSVEPFNRSLAVSKLWSNKNNALIGCQYILSDNNVDEFIKQRVIKEMSYYGYNEYGEYIVKAN